MGRRVPPRKADVALLTALWVAVSQATTLPVNSSRGGAPEGPRAGGTEKL